MESGSKITKKYSFKSKACRQKIEKILELISTEKLCRRQISEQIHVNVPHTSNYINYLMANKLIYISSWKLELQGERVMFYPYYRAGDKKSKPKPKNISIAQKSKRYREKLNKDEERKEKINSRRRTKRITVKPDWTTSWIKASNTTQTNDAGA